MAGRTRTGLPARRLRRQRPARPGLHGSRRLADRGCRRATRGTRGRAMGTAAPRWVRRDQGSSRSHTRKQFRREENGVTAPTVSLGGKVVGTGHPVYVVAEIGINHNGDLEIAKQLIDKAAEAGVDAVKFQKRTPEIATPADMRDTRRVTPWGEMSYLEYRERVEFGVAEYEEIDRYCKLKGVAWFASPWDVPSVHFLEEFDTVCYKIASASLTDLDLLSAIRETGRPDIASTGMSTVEEVDRGVETLGTKNLVLLHTTSTYPCPPEEVNLRTLDTLRERYGVPTGYSGHERGLQVSIAAVALGACL